MNENEQGFVGAEGSQPASNEPVFDTSTQETDTTSASQSTDTGDTGAQQYTQETGDTSGGSDDGVITSSATSRGTVLQLVLNPQTGQKELREVKVGTNEDEGTKPAQNANVAVPEGNQGGLVLPEQQSAPKTAYTDSELALALQMGTPVDESRLTPTMAVAYGQYKERVAQQEAIKRAEAENAQAQNPANNEETAQNTKARQEFYQRVDNMAKEYALQELGLTEDDLIAAEYTDDEDLIKRAAAFRVAEESQRQNILRYVADQEQKAVQAQNVKKAIMNDIYQFAANAQKTEAKFNEINLAMETYYKKLPYEKAEKYSNAVKAFKQGNITAEQVKDLQAYYDETRKAIYAQANGLSTSPKKVVNRPNTVIRPGSGASVPTPSADATQLRDLTVREREEWIRRNL